MSLDNNIIEYKIGRIYFKISYYDIDFLYPNIETLVYLGKYSELKDRFESIFKRAIIIEDDFQEDDLYFQDAESYSEYGFSSSNDSRDVKILLVRDRRVKSCIFDLDGMIRELHRWSLTWK